MAEVREKIRYVGLRGKHWYNMILVLLWISFFVFFFFAIGMKFCSDSTCYLLYIFFHRGKTLPERNVSCKRVQINMFAFIFVTWIFLYYRCCGQQCWVSISFFVFSEVMYMQKFFLSVCFLLSTYIISIF